MKPSSSPTAVILNVMGVRPVHVCIPLFLTLGIAGLSGLSVGLLLPVVEGFVKNDFSSVENLPAIGAMLKATGWNVYFKESGRMFLLLVAVIVSAQVLKNILLYMNFLYVSRWGSVFAANIRKAVFDRYLRFGKRYFDRTGQGKLQTIAGYCEQISFMINQLLAGVIAGAKIVVFVGILLYISWPLTLVTLCMYPCLNYVLRRLTSPIRDLSKEKQETSLRIGHDLFNIISGIAVVKMYSSETKLKKKYATLVDKYHGLEFQTNALVLLVPPLQEVIMTLFVMLMVGGIVIFLSGAAAASLAPYIVFLYITKETISPAATLAKSFAVHASFRGILTELAQIFSEEDKEILPDGKMEFTGLKEEIRIANADFSYEDGTPVLKGLDLVIRKGTVTALVGESGAGKTTIVNLLLRLYDVPEESIYIDGCDIRLFRVASLRKHIACVSQDVFLFHDTIRNNLLFGLPVPPNERELHEALERAALLDFVQQLPLGLDTSIGDRGVQLSGGQKQRLSIARALLKDAEILILDEATSSLDSESESSVQTAIQELMQGRTSLVIAHRLSTIEHADLVAVIKDGKVVEQGSIADLLRKKDEFYRLWKAQSFTEVVTQ